MPDVPRKLGLRRAPQGLVRNLALSDIQIRDPFVVRDPDSDLYYLFGSTDPNIWDGPGIGFDAYRNRDLADWESPFAAFRPQDGFLAERRFWAPEVYGLMVPDGRCEDTVGRVAQG